MNEVDKSSIPLSKGRNQETKTYLSLEAFEGTYSRENVYLAKRLR